FVDAGDRDDSLGRDRLRCGAEGTRSQGDPRIRAERQLVPFTHREHVELETRGPGFGEHTRTLQEDKAWFAPVSETAQTAHDLVCGPEEQLLRKAEALGPVEDRLVAAMRWYAALDSCHASDP